MALIVRFDGTRFQPWARSGSTALPARPVAALAGSAQGGVWVAYWGGWNVTRFDPKGKVERTVKLPVKQPTCPAFGGPNLDICYVTSARIGGADNGRSMCSMSHAASVAWASVSPLPIFREPLW